MSFGQTLREAREAKGLTPEKVAADTHILVQIINDMENENFKRIPAPIYGRGFIRLFAEEVGLAPEPLIQEYMDIINGRRRPVLPPRAPDPIIPPPAVDDIPPAVEPPPPINPFGIQEPPAPQPEPVSPHLWDPDPLQPHTVATPVPEPIPEPEPIPVPPPPPMPEPIPVPPPPPMPEPIPEPIPEPMPEPIPPPPPPRPNLNPVVSPLSPELEGLPLFGQSRPAAAPTPPQSETNPLPPQVDTESILPSSYDEEGPSIGERFRKSITAASSNIVHRAKDIPRRTWRIALVAVVALLVLALMVFGCVKLYQATSRPPVIPRGDAPAEIKSPKKPAPAPAKPAAKPTTSAKPAATKSPAPARTAAKPTTSAKPAAKAPSVPGKLRSTGQKVPSLYMD